MVDCPYRGSFPLSDEQAKFDFPTGSGNAAAVEQSSSGSGLARLLHNPWAWVAVFLLAAFAAPLVYVQYTIARIPDIGEPFDVVAHKSFTLPETENAFTNYREAMRSYSRLDFVVPANSPRWEAADKSLDEAHDKGWSAANEDVRKWVEVNRPAMRIWREGTKFDNAIEVPLNELTISSSLDAAQALRDFARLALLEASRFTEEGKTDEAWEWYRATLRSGRHVGIHACMIGRHVGNAILLMSVEPIQRWAAHSNVSADDLRRALADVQSIDAMTLPNSDTLKNEYFIILNTSAAEIEEVENMRLGWLYRWSGQKERDRRLNRLVFANWLSQCDQPRYRRKLIVDDKLGLFDTGSTIVDSQLYPPADIQNWDKVSEAAARYFRVPHVWSFMVPADRGFLAGVDRGEARQGVLEISLATQIHQREHGSFPEKLESLVERGYLSALPADPFGKGEPLRYRREPDGSATIWSLAEDGIDQNGKVHREDAWSTTDNFDDVWRITLPVKK